MARKKKVEDVIEPEVTPIVIREEPVVESNIETVKEPEVTIDELTVLADKYGTDKGSKAHNFTSFYDKHLNSYHEQFKKVIEIGVWKGESLSMWKDYFVNATIIGCDIEDKSMYNSDRIVTCFMDQSSKQQLENFELAKDADLIIDDGSHFMDHQQMTLPSMFKKLKSGGYYILEDLHSSYLEDWCKYYPKNKTIDYILKIKEGIDFDSRFMSAEESKYLKDNIEFVDICENSKLSITCIIKKK